MGLFGFLNSSSSYEEVLSNISSKITKNKKIILVSKFRQRRVKRIFTIYAVLAYIGHLLVTLLRKRLRNVTPYDSIIILGSPVLIFLLRQIIRFYYQKSIERAEERLGSLRLKQEEKIEELKKKTNFYSTQTLLRRYGDDESLDIANAFEGSSQVSDEYLAQKFNLINEYDQISGRNNVAWYDKIMEYVLGEDESSPRNRYALICTSCYNHNGLAPPGSKQPSKIFYICPNCGAQNGEMKESISKLDKVNEENEGTSIVTEPEESAPNNVEIEVSPPPQTNASGVEIREGPTSEITSRSAAKPEDKKL